MQEYIFFLGAGASVPFGIPTMTDMVSRLEAQMKESHYALQYVVDDIKNRLKDYGSFDIEALITVLQDINQSDTAAQRVFNHPSLHYYIPSGYSNFVSYTQTWGKNRQSEAKELLRYVENFVAESCKMTTKQFGLFSELFASGRGKEAKNYRNRIKRSERRTENLIFTTNYDQTLEAYCSHQGFDYEVGESRAGRLDLSANNTELYDWNSDIHKIFKLHGSINWYSDDNGVFRWSSEPVKTGETTALGHTVTKELLVYPAFAKYTFREPFYTMFHYLKESLTNCGMCHVVGYSFRDDDILGLFHDALQLQNNLRLTIIDPMAEAIVEEKFSKYEDRVFAIPGAFSLEAAERLQNRVTLLKRD